MRDAPTAVESALETATLADVVEAAVRACVVRGLRPREAAVQSEGLQRLSPNDLLTLAQLGLSELVNSRLHSQRRGQRGEEDAHGDEPAPSPVNRLPVAGPSETQRRRAALYAKVRDALGMPYVGADGSMRPLYDFTAEDHKARMKEVKEVADGHRKQEAFHRAALAALKGAGVETIAALPKKEQARLRAML